MNILKEYTEWLKENKNIDLDKFAKVHQKHYMDVYGDVHDYDNHETERNAFTKAWSHAKKMTMKELGLNNSEFNDHMERASNRHLDEAQSSLSEGEHWDKVRRSNTAEIQNAQNYAQQMIQDHGDDETVQKLAAVILKLNPNSNEHQEQILDAAKQLDDYVAQQVGHKPADDEKK